MIHPSYSELMQVVNSNATSEEEPIVNSRYSIVLATSKRARQLIAGNDALVEDDGRFMVAKPLSTAVKELYSGVVEILPETEEEIEITESETIETPVELTEEAAKA